MPLVTFKFNHHGHQVLNPDCNPRVKGGLTQDSNADCPRIKMQAIYYGSGEIGAIAK